MSVLRRLLTLKRAPTPTKMLIDCANHEPKPRFWTYFSNGPEVVAVFGYPSKGGVYILTGCFGLELDFLGLRRFEDKERSSSSDPDRQVKEYVHCGRREFSRII